ncbi:MAG TPA: zinc ribbon domain-containing protein [Blastocatellia bacterium]|nr:zinc ribbon domain-containing protein [Blastocatellia bacterium]
MHCPSCGTEASTDQKFCRLCGLSLDRFAQLLAEELPSGVDPATAAAIDKDQRPERMAKVGLWGITVLAIGGGALVALIAYKIVATFIIEQGEIFVGVALLLVLLGVAMAVAALGYADALRKFKTRNTDEVESSKGRAVPLALPRHESSPESNITAGIANFISLSVTEGTTELLESGNSLDGDRPQAPASRTRV